MAYQSLYRKYRPQTFADVMGQGHVTRTLQNALASGRIAHGYLFTGTRGTAKTTVARLLAKSLNCLSSDQPVAEPCNQCDACASIMAGTCMDVIEMDAASHRGVADIEEVRKAVGYGPMQFRYKVFIIDEAHQLSSDAKDAFLKTLEEPPGNVVFILATTEPQSIPITIRSRCQQFDFRRGSLADIATRLHFVLDREKVSYDPAALSLIARGAEGSYRDSLSLLEQVLAFAPRQITAADVEAVLGTLDQEMLRRTTEIVAQRDAPAAFALAGELLDEGKEARTLLKALSSHFRDLLLVSVGGPAVTAELTPEEIVLLQDQAKWFTPPQLMQAMDIANDALSSLRWNNLHRPLIELTFLKLMGIGEAQNSGQTFAVAPIAAAPIAEKPAAPEPPRSAPLPAPLPVAETNDAPLSAAYFASDDAADGSAESAAADDAIEYVPEDEDAPLFDPEPELEREPDAPASAVIVAVRPDASAGSSDTTDADLELSAMLSVGDAAPILEKAPAPTAPLRTAAAAAVPPPVVVARAATSGGDEITLDAVIRVWPRLLRDAEKVSKQAAVMLAKAMPTDVSGHTITLTFGAQMNYEMMSLPKKQEFVRKLLARCLNVESVSLQLVLDGNAPLPRPTRSKKQDAPGRLDNLEATLAALDAAPDSGFGGPGGGGSENGDSGWGKPTSAPPGDDFFTQAVGESRAAGGYDPRHSMRAATTLSSPPRVAEAAQIAGTQTAPARDTDSGVSPVGQNEQREQSESARRDADQRDAARRDAVMEDPLIQEALSIFGGEIVRES